MVETLEPKFVCFHYAMYGYHDCCWAESHTSDWLRLNSVGKEGSVGVEKTGLDP